MIQMINLKKIQGYVIGTLLLVGSIGGIQSTFAALPISQIQLASGAKLYFVETQSIPMVDIGLDFSAGSVFDPRAKSGLADFTAGLLNKGSVLSGVPRNEAYIADKISDQGAIVSFSASSESANVRIRSLSRSDVLNSVVAQLADMLAYPVYDPKILEREKQRALSALKEEDTKPDVMLSKQFQRMVYQNHPFGFQETQNSIRSIRVEDLKRFHHDYYRASHANVLIVGALTKERAIQIANQLTAKLPKGPELSFAIPAVDQLPKKLAAQREVRLASQSQQAHIQIGMIGVPRNDPDYFPLMVGNYILGGGGFASRLMNEVREKRALAYGVSSYFYPGQISGIFAASLQTKSDQADQALDVMRSTIALFIDKGPTDQELQSAKDNLVNGFPLRIDSNQKLLQNLSGIASHHLPLNTLDIWNEQVSQVTREQVIQAFQKHLDMDRMITVLVGAK